MVWAGFSAFGKTPLVFVTHRMNSKDYQNVLENNLLPYMRRFRSIRFTYQQDNASIHVSTDTEGWLKRKKISTLSWPARSPDLNPMENLWGILVRDIYADCRQFDNVDQLKEAIQEAWDRVPLDQLSRLVKSMSNRMIQVIERHGKVTDY
jgi:transposase